VFHPILPSPVIVSARSDNGNEKGTYKNGERSESYISGGMATDIGAIPLA
jgi:hypothetical protein